MATQSVAVASATEIKPGDVKMVDVNGRRVAIANADGSFYAFDDTCTHEECSLAEGFLEGTVITCPCHLAQFDISTGRVVAPPAPRPVKTYPIRIEAGQLMIDV
jgi:3-phenylpropionate/trans-cinnamate dioxygenase ferredoxin component